MDIYISYQYPNHHAGRKRHCSKNCKYGPRANYGRTHYFFIETQLLLSLPLNYYEAWHLNNSHKTTFRCRCRYFMKSFYYWKCYIGVFRQYCPINLCFPILVVFTVAASFYNQGLDECC